MHTLPAAATTEPIPHPGMSFRAFVALMALLFAGNALAIDSMLPAFPAIARSFALPDPNEVQWVLYAFLLGYGGGHLIYGPLADRYGRRAVLIPALLLFVLTALIAGFASSFPLLLAARILQGLAGAAGRVLAIAIVRDCYSGRKMARVMSLTSMVFMIVPIMAPSFGQAVLLIAPWPWIFRLLGAFTFLVAVWAMLRLPETLHPEFRRPISFAVLGSGVARVLTQRSSLGYTLAITMLSAEMYGYLGSAQQIFGGVFGVPQWFPLIFAGCAVVMSATSFGNSLVVERLGMRLVSHSALLAFIALAGVHLLITLAGYEQLWVFSIFQAVLMATLILANSNFGAMAMEHVGDVAGMASSIQGFITTIGGTLLGMGIGQAFDGSTAPLIAGYLIGGLATLVVVLVTERGHLFHAQRTAA